jgi:probable DNA metabolism protein
MPARVNLAYQYDGSFEGFLSCVFESFEKQEIPSAIFAEEPEQLSFCPVRFVETDQSKALRVLASIPRKISPHAQETVQVCFLSNHPQKELLLLGFLRQGYRFGAAVENRLADPTVNAVMKAVKFVYNESHLINGFLRFSDFGGVLVSIIHPKNFVLPLIQPHFCKRYPNESFFIYDATHKTALAYRPHEWKYLAVDSFTMPEKGEEEAFYRKLWKEYYNTIAVEGRYNPRCRMGHMPKRYWADMTEFQDDSTPAPSPDFLNAVSSAPKIGGSTVKQP